MVREKSGEGSLFFKTDRCLVIAEVAQSHEGSLGQAHAFIDAIADAGADAVKFQTHLAQEETTIREPWRIPLRTQDATRFDYWRRMEFAAAHWEALCKHARERNLLFLSSPFSHAGVELLARVGVDAWKVASGEVSNIPLLKEMAKYPKPFLLSTGMSPLSEIDMAVNEIRKTGQEFIVMQCNSSYPCPPERVGLNMLQLFRERYSCGVGISDHSATVFPSLSSMTLGASAVEIHVTFDRKMFGPDVSSSVTFEELRVLCNGRDFISKMLSHPVDKDSAAAEKIGMKKIFGKSIVAKTKLAPGSRISEEMLLLKKPGTGLPADMMKAIVGKKLKVALEKDDEILLEHLDSE